MTTARCMRFRMEWYERGALTLGTFEVSTTSSNSHSLLRFKFYGPPAVDELGAAVMSTWILQSESREKLFFGLILQYCLEPIGRTFSYIPEFYLFNC